MVKSQWDWSKIWLQYGKSLSEEHDPTINILIIRSMLLFFFWLCGITLFVTATWVQEMLQASWNRKVQTNSWHPLDWMYISMMEESLPMQLFTWNQGLLLFCIGMTFFYFSCRLPRLAGICRALVFNTTSNPVVAVKLLNQQGKFPVKGTEGSAGWDLFSSEGVILNAGEIGTVSTGISIQIPSGYYGRIAPRSGLAAKFGIDVLGGVVDPDYTGDVGVILINHAKTSFTVQKGDRIAQLIITPVSMMPFLEVDSLHFTKRGSEGFGSTGKA